MTAAIQNPYAGFPILRTLRLGVYDLHGIAKHTTRRSDSPSVLRILTAQLKELGKPVRKRTQYNQQFSLTTAYKRDGKETRFPRPDRGVFFLNQIPVSKGVSLSNWERGWG